jgi:hypothetical protein
MMSDTEERRRQRCVNCGSLSPEASTSYTLISVKHSWRMVLSVGPDGKKLPQWYCPRCWEQRRRQTAP